MAKYIVQISEDDGDLLSEDEYDCLKTVIAITREHLKVGHCVSIAVNADKSD